MKAGSINLQKLFEQTIQYRIPLFQRPYVWEEHKNWQPIWEDIRTLVENTIRAGDPKPHFLGAIVLDQVLNQTGAIESRQVIDGQQRLTTLQLMLAAFRDLAAELGQEKAQKRFDKLTLNDESFQESTDDAFKVWPTNRDRKAFRHVMSAGSLEKACNRFSLKLTSKKLEPFIPGAYLFFYRSAKEWLGSELTDDRDAFLDVSLEKRLDTLWSVVRSQLLLVAIDLENDDDAQVIFETLNHRGTQLLPADLIKNLLFQLAEKNDANLDDLYKKYWKGFEVDFWRQESRQGRLKRPRIDLFLQHYLTLKTTEEVQVSHVFTSYKQHVDAAIRKGEGALFEGGPIAFQLAELRNYGRIFRIFLESHPVSRFGKFFERLDAVDTATVYPVLLAAFHQLNTPNSRVELKRLLRDIESFLVRRMICGLTTKNYNKLFLDLIRTCDTSGGFSHTRVKDFLVSGKGDSNRWPDNKEFREAMLEAGIYRRLSQKKLRMVLLALDKEMEDGKTEPVIYTDADSFTIEHIMPQGWQKHWPLPLERYPNEDKASLSVWRDKLIHTIGNLTLLTNKLNPAISDKNWETKKAKILATSKLNLNRSYFGDIEDWNEEEISTRSRKLCQLAVRIWPYPPNVSHEQDKVSEA
jgi:hypothetical protein